MRNTYGGEPEKAGAQRRESKIVKQSYSNIRHKWNSLLILSGGRPQFHYTFNRESIQVSKIIIYWNIIFSSLIVSTYLTKTKINTSSNSLPAVYISEAVLQCINLAIYEHTCICSRRSPHQFSETKLSPCFH